MIAATLNVGQLP